MFLSTTAMTVMTPSEAERILRLIEALSVEPLPKNCLGRYVSFAVSPEIMHELLVTWKLARTTT